MNSELENNEIELYRCHPDNWWNGCVWAIQLLFLLGFPIYIAFSEQELYLLFLFWAIFSPFILLSLDQGLWNIFGEEVGVIEGEYLHIRRRHRLFRRNWRVLLHEIGEVDYYSESTWRWLFKSFFRAYYFTQDTLCLNYGVSERKYIFAPYLPSDKQDEVLDRLEEAVAAAKEREGIKVEEEYWEAVEESPEDDEEISNE